MRTNKIQILCFKKIAHWIKFKTFNMVCEWSLLGPIIFCPPHNFCLCFNYLDISDTPVSFCVVWPPPLSAILQLHLSLKTCFLNHICPELALPLFFVKFHITPVTRPFISIWSFPSYLAINLNPVGYRWIPAGSLLWFTWLPDCHLVLAVTSWASQTILMKPWRHLSPFSKIICRSPKD